ncbi:MAG: ATP-binding cassette domain-containing protein, partial [Bacteroidota bacterium]
SGLHFKPGQKVIDIIKDAAEQIQMGTGEKLGASQALQLFGFSRSMQQNFVEQLSGGEKRRLYLLRVLMENPNFLILDEPTNDLDIITLNTLEQFLLAYQGCLIIVSHDRYFLDKLCDHLFIFEGQGNVKPYPGTFREYRARKKALEAEKAAPKVKKDTRVVNRDSKKLSYKETKEYEGLEGEIDALETRKSELETQINNAGTDYENLQKWSAELKQVEADLEAKSDRWLELAERVGD